MKIFSWPSAKAARNIGGISKSYRKLSEIPACENQRNRPSAALSQRMALVMKSAGCVAIIG